MDNVEKLLIEKGSYTAGKSIIHLPSSKSISNRLLIMQALSKGAVQIENLSTADDTKFLKAFLTESSENKWVGEAGTALRFGLAWAAVSPGVHILDGEDRIRRRPISGLVNALRELGADVSYVEREGFAPLAVNGKHLEGGALKVEGHLSSQYVSAILMIAPYCEKGISLELSDQQVSIPYIEMTVNLMRQAGVEVSWERNIISVKPGSYSEGLHKVESDWSATSYFYALKMLDPNLDIRMEGLSENSLQGDSAIISMVEGMGLITSIEGSVAELKSKDVLGFPSQMDFSGSPDLAQTFAVIAAAAKSPMRLEGLQTLRVKETDRIAAVVTELKKCGVHCDFDEKSISLKTFENPEGIPEIATYQDHRMAMAFAPLAAVYGKIVICNPGVVSKSFPDYWNQLERLGFQLTKIYT